MKTRFIVFFALLLAAGCATVPITESLLGNLNSSDYGSIQFMTSEQMILQQRIDTDDVTVTDNNRIGISSDDRMNNIRFPKKTRGVLMDIIERGGRRFMVMSFDTGSHNVMVFESVGSQGRFYPYRVGGSRSVRYTFYGPIEEFSEAPPSRYRYKISGSAAHLIAGADNSDRFRNNWETVGGRRVGQ